MQINLKTLFLKNREVSPRAKGEISFARGEKRPLETSPFLPFLLAWVLLFQVGIVFAGQLGVEPKVAVVVSGRIKPYMQVLKGLEQGANYTNQENETQDLNLEIFFLSPSESQDRVAEKLLKDRYDVFVAIGPEAAQLIWSMEELDKQVKIFSAMLESPIYPGDKSFGCGVSFKIPIAVQVSQIAASLPDVKNLGLLFDREYNQTFFENARSAGKSLQVNIIALAVDSKKEIPRILKENLDRIDCIWMVPDQTVISEKIVQYVIKEALYHKKGVIGYNSFFIRSGAVFAFEFDYTSMGTQTAEMVNAYFEQGLCQSVDPFFNTTINLKMTRTLGLRVGESR